MTFRQFALNNVFRNNRLYVAYFLSSMFAVMVFFTFTMFAFHPAFQADDMPSSAMYGMLVSGGIIYVFSFFFVLYSMSSFLQSRKKEFGLLMLLGMSSRQVRRMTFLENMVIGFFATVSGIGMGLVFAKLILLIAEKVLVIEESFPFYFPLEAIGLSFISFILLFFIISIFVTFILRTNKLVELIKSDKKSKGEPKASIILAILAALLLVVGYGTALYVEGLQVVTALIPVVIVVTIGTYLLFTQLSVFIIRRLKKDERIFWKKTNMLLFSDLSFRMKDNARTFFLVAIISTVAFSAIGTLFGLHAYLTKGLKDTNPYSFVYYSVEEDDVPKQIAAVDHLIADEKVTASKEVMEMNYFEIGIDYPVLIVKESDYNRFAKLADEKEIALKNQAVVVPDAQKNINNSKNEDKLMERKISLSSGESVQAYSKFTSNTSGVLQEANAYYIVRDEVFEQLPSPQRQRTFAAWMAEQADDEQVITIGENMFEHFNQYHNAYSIDHTVYQVERAYGPVLFIGLFIGIVFFVSAGSFLYFRLYSDLDDDKAKFRSIAKLGLTEKELKQVINRQTAILFFAPIIVAMVHGAVALTALSHLFDYNLVKQSAMVLGTFACIQIIYFLIVRHFYTKQIKQAIQ